MTDTRPDTPDALHAWIQTALGVIIPRRALIAGHQAPFEYLQHAFFDGGDCVVWANRGGGKTFLGAVATALDLLFKPGIQVRILAGSLEQARRMHAHMRGLFTRENLASHVDGRITDRRLQLTNGSCVELLAQSHASVRGTRVQTLRCDEVELFTPEIWEAAQLVTRSATLDGVRAHGSIECLSTMHRPYGLMQRLIEESRRGVRKLFRWGVVDVLEVCDDSHQCQSEAGPCPLLVECGGRAKDTARLPGHIAIDDAIRMKQRVSLATWEAEMLCLRPTRSDAVLPQFDVKKHVIKHVEVPPDAMWIGGMDFGYRSPTVVLWGVVDARGVLWIVDERVVANVTVGEHIRAIEAASHPAFAWIGVDPAGAQANEQTGSSAITLLREAGHDVRHRITRVDVGLDCVRARLAPASGPPRLFISARCTALIQSLETYHYPHERPESTNPVKDGADHAVDALRYMIVNLDKPTKATLSHYAAGR